MKPMNTIMFPNQQDSAPAHKARTTQEWLRANVPDFISTSDWPSSTPDLNPLDYKLWSVLQTMACKKRSSNIDSLKRALVQVARHFPINTVRNAIDEWPARFRACIKAKGGHFEN